MRARIIVVALLVAALLHPLWADAGRAAPDRPSGCRARA